MCASGFDHAVGEDENAVGHANVRSEAHAPRLPRHASRLMRARLKAQRRPCVIPGWTLCVDARQTHPAGTLQAISDRN
jgi:hypothetical protein